MSPSTATPQWPAGRVTQSPRVVAFLDLPGDNDRLLVDHYSRAEDLERVTFGKRDPFLSKVGRGSHVDCERLLLGLHREMRPAKSMTASAACAGDRLDALNSALIVVSVLTSYIGEAPPVPVCAITTETAAKLSRVAAPTTDKCLSEAMINLHLRRRDRHAAALSIESTNATSG